MANAPNAGYWLIALNLQREDGLRPLVDEIDEVVASWKQQNPGQQIEDLLYEFTSTAELPLLTSTIQETLRYAASVMSIRRVTEPVEFGGYRFDTDDEIICMTRSVHLDEEIHENASEYDPRRYMRQKRFSKNGKIVTNHSMLWGGGVSMCEGRFVYPSISMSLTLQLTIFRSLGILRPGSSKRLWSSYSCGTLWKSIRNPLSVRRSCWNGWELASCIPEVTSGSFSTLASDDDYMLHLAVGMQYDDYRYILGDVAQD